MSDRLEKCVIGANGQWSLKKAKDPEESSAVPSKPSNMKSMHGPVKKVKQFGDYSIKSHATGDVDDHDRDVHRHEVSYRGKAIGTLHTRVEGGHHQNIGSDLPNEHDLHVDKHIVEKL